MHGTIGLKNTLATVTPHIPLAPVLPTFKPRWWFRTGCLDARPVIWSIYNHPDEWTPTRYCLLHKPSQHEFWIDGRCHLYRANCSCTSNGGNFQPFQQRAFRRAVRWWRASQINTDGFAGHFVH